MPDERHPIQVDPAGERPACLRVPGPPLVEVQQQQPRPDGLLVPQVVARPGAVEEALVDGRSDEPAAGQVLAEVRVAGLVLGAHRVVPVHDEDQWERPITFGHPHPGVQRQGLRPEAPRHAPRLVGAPADRAQRPARVHRWGPERDVLAEGRPAIRPTAVAERRERVRPGSPGILEPGWGGRAVEGRRGSDQVVVRAGVEEQRHSRDTDNDGDADAQPDRRDTRDTGRRRDPPRRAASQAHAGPDEAAEPQVGREDTVGHHDLAWPHRRDHEDK